MLIPIGVSRDELERVSTIVRLFDSEYFFLE